MSFPTKHPAERVYAGTDWSRVLANGETIASAEVFITSKNLAADPNASVMLSGITSVNGNIVSHLLIGGVENVLYITTWRIVTSTPRTLEERVTLSVA
jgi:hypothetical protein